ncbi:hypothetical protein HYALB_00001980 [Hymenoscyphus albidus]|uniref:Uncharacterized protein n=1 Tax=Hymenoscyphus albidus TaxID=595503 RepID=A0A9N9Q1Y8_9HELO|nr:hypothetical protein HYALB_00001980 [Hymenoscyphus albidus]
MYSTHSVAAAHYLVLQNHLIAIIAGAFQVLLQHIELLLLEAHSKRFLYLPHTHHPQSGSPGQRRAVDSQCEH